MRVLIYFDKNMLSPTGGPSGYLYNIYNELKLNKIDTIEFLDNKKLKLKMKVRQIIKKSPKFIKKIQSKRYENYGENIIKKVFYSKTFKTSIDLNKYDIIHFHSTLSMYMIKDSLKDYKGSIILTSHTPKAPYLEIIDHINEKNLQKYKNEISKLSIVDEFAFDRANYILFPTVEAEECYYNTWDKYAEIHKRNKDKYVYIPTGINRVNFFEDRETIRKKYGIPQDAFLISYIGRHNEVKGYDNLKKIGKEILKRDKEIYFIIGGKEEPIKGLEDNRWIEIGWTDKPHDLVNASDLFILPNKETYFDLVMLEVLSLGKTILLTNTGGNKSFKKFNSERIVFYNYDDINDAIEKIEKIKNINSKENEDINKNIFKENFDISIFVGNYINFLKELYEKNGKK